MKRIAFFVVLLSLFGCQSSFALPLHIIELQFDLTPDITSDSEFGAVAFVQGPAFYPGEYLLGPDFKAGTKDDIYIDPFDVPPPWGWAADLRLLYASASIAPAFQSGQKYYGTLWYDGGGIEEYIFPGILGMQTIGWSDYYTFVQGMRAVVIGGGTGHYDPIPEPATMLLFVTGIVGLVGSLIRCRKR